MRNPRPVAIAGVLVGLGFSGSEVLAAPVTSAPASGSVGVRASETGREAERLPMELPQITVTGRRLRLPKGKGRKLALEDPDWAGMIEPPPPVRALSGTLGSLQLPVPPERPEARGHVGEPPKEASLTILELGLGDLALGVPSRWRGRVGGAGAWQTGDWHLLTDTRAELNALEGWSTWSLDQEILHGTGAWVHLGLEAAHRQVGRQEVVRQGVEIAASWDDACSGCTLTFGRAEVESRTPAGPWLASQRASQTRWQLEGRRDVEWGPGFRADWTFGQVAGEGGEPDGRQGLLARGRLSARPWQDLPEGLSLELGLGGTQLGTTSYLDPAVRMAWQPSLPAQEGLPEQTHLPLEMGVALASHADWPDLAGLLRRRDPVLGRLGLRPVRVEPRLEGTVSWRLAPEWYVSGHVSAARVLDAVVWREVGSGMWSIRQDPRWQPRLEAGAVLQWQPAESWSQELTWSLEDLPWAGVRHQELRLAHDARWPLDLVAGLDVLLEADALSGSWLLSGQAAEGSAVRLEGVISRAVDERTEAFVRATSWPLVALREPAPGFYMRPALLVAGLSRRF
ncbi:MAG: hypothetical protein VKO21_06135 [Candidatus Sericytochromatia bacterium]|nr:hypothetical protein [Candidatus Sericytochromatia bacterium]